MPMYTDIKSVKEYHDLVQELGFEEFILAYFVGDTSGYCPCVLNNIEGFENFISCTDKECDDCDFCGDEDLMSIEEFGDEDAEYREEKFLICHERCFMNLNYVPKKSNKEKY